MMKATSRVVHDLFEGLWFAIGTARKMGSILCAKRWMKEERAKYNKKDGRGKGFVRVRRS